MSTGSNIAGQFRNTCVGQKQHPSPQPFTAKRNPTSSIILSTSHAMKLFRLKKKNDRCKSKVINNNQKTETTQASAAKQEANHNQNYVNPPRVAARTLLLSIMARCEEGADDDSFDAGKSNKHAAAVKIIRKEDIPLENKVAGGGSGGRSVASRASYKLRRSLSRENPVDDDDDRSDKRNFGSRDDSSFDSVEELCSLTQLEQDGESHPSELRTQLSSPLSSSGTIKAMLINVSSMENNEHDTPAEKERKNLFDMSWFAKPEDNIQPSFVQADGNELFSVTEEARGNMDEAAANGEISKDSVRTSFEDRPNKALSNDTVTTQEDILSGSDSTAMSSLGCEDHSSAMVPAAGSVASSKNSSQKGRGDESSSKASYPEYVDSSGMRAGGWQSPPRPLPGPYQQQTVDGDTVCTLDDLYGAATIAKPVYEETISRIIDQVCGDGSGPQAIVNVAEMKSRDSALEKANCEDGRKDKMKDGSEFSWLYDIVRGSILFCSAEQMMKCIALLQQDPFVHVVNIYDTFKDTSTSFTGYKLLNLHIQIDTKQGFQHICELQIHHVDIPSLDLASVEKSTLDELLEEKMDLKQLERLAEAFCDQLCQFDWAHCVYLKLLDMQCNKLGEDHIDVATTCLEIGCLLHEYMGQPKDAVEMYERALSIQMKKLGDSDPAIAATHAEIGNALCAEGETKEALKAYEKSTNILQKQDKEQYSWVDIACQDISSLLRVEDMMCEALAMYSKSLSVYKLNMEDGLSILNDTFAEMSKEEEESQEQFDEVLKFHNESLDVCKKRLVETNIRPGSPGSVMKEQGKLDEAFEIYAKTLIDNFHLQQQRRCPAA
eukprot:scaffold3103_cov136-Cylindrotheca_fusiformis.AAC.12